MILATSLAGCAFSGADLPRLSHDAAVPHTANFVVADHPMSAAAAAVPPPAALHADPIDVTTLLQTVIALPQHVERVERLGRAIVVAALIVALVGAINAALLARLLIAVRRAPAQPVPAAPVPVPVSVPVAVAKIGASCACGASISPRTKSGRCRACALEERSRRSSARGQSVRLS